jgi:hypothetical protein
MQISLIALLAQVSGIDDVRAQSVVMLRRVDLSGDAALQTASARASGDLYEMKRQLQRRNSCEQSTTERANPTIADAQTLPHIVVCGHSDVRGDEIPQAKAVALSVESARARDLQLGISSPIRGSPMLGAGFAAWTDPGNIQYWLRSGQ